MILERVEITVTSGQEKDFEGALLEVRQRLFSTAGFRGFTVAQSIEQPATYLVQVRWETLAERAELEDTGRAAKAWAPVTALTGPLRSGFFSPRESLDSQGPGVVTDLSWMS